MEGQAPPTFEPLDRVDFALALLTIPLLLIVLMFAVTGMAERFATRRTRRRIGLALVAAEAAIVGVTVMAIT